MNHKLRGQLLPLLLTVVTFGVLCVILYAFLSLLNLFPIKEKVVLHLRLSDILVGLTIYLKTSIDFAIFIGNVMRSNPGVKGRIAIEIGTAVGNAGGTLLILLIWNFFREVPLLMVIMIIIASLVLLQMAEESLEELVDAKSNFFKRIAIPTIFLLTKINHVFSPILKKILPNTSMKQKGKLSFFSLLLFSASIPFILGLDDFAGYIPLFSVVNVFGFSVGVFLGHMILNAALFVSPEKTTKLVRHPIILLIGGLAFIGIAAWGAYEALHLLFHIFA